MKVITYDHEIAKPIPEDEDGNANWDAAKQGKCGVSVVCLFDTSTSRYHVYDQHTIRECILHLNDADMLIGYNSIEFDTPALSAVAKAPIAAPQFDVLKGIWRALKRDGKSHGGYRLGEVCERTLGLKKTLDGPRAPSLFASGRWGELVDYCINDVHLTRMLHNHIVEERYIVKPDGSRLALPNWMEEYA